MSLMVTLSLKKGENQYSARGWEGGDPRAGESFGGDVRKQLAEE